MPLNTNKQISCIIHNNFFKIKIHFSSKETKILLIPVENYVIKTDIIRYQLQPLKTYN